MRASSRRSCCRIHCRSPPASRSRRRRSIVSSGSASRKIQKDVGKARAISDASCSGSRATGPNVDAPTPVVTRLWRHERVAWASVTLAALITAASVSFIRVHDQAPMAALGRFQIALPAGSLSFTLSPDGRNLAFIAPGLNGRTRIPVDSSDGFARATCIARHGERSHTAVLVPGQSVRRVLGGRQAQENRRDWRSSADHLRGSSGSSGRHVESG